MQRGLSGLRPGSRPGLLDWTLAVGVTAVLLASAVTGRQPATDLDLLGYALLLTSGLALAANRSAPVTVLAVTGFCALAYQALGFEVPAVAYLFAVYASVRAGHRLVTVAASVVMLVVLPFTLLASPHDLTLDQAFTDTRDALQIAWLIAAGAAGEALRQAERRADEAERTREETARRRADEERLHIARELHDSLTHQISVIKLQAEVAVHVARRKGEQVSEPLLAIQQAGGEAARELRATLEALRDEDTAPPLGLDDLPELVERSRSFGVNATLSVQGRPRDLSSAVDRTVYRIVQESLTNIARHSGAATAQVRIEYGPDDLAIRVEDDGTAVPDRPPTAGVGLLGMRERVTALGGRLSAEPRREGGFAVRVELPVDAGA